ncbi:MAG: carboxypeptidase-like regulatory domain-containing protein [Bacillota bacterium]
MAIIKDKFNLTYSDDFSLQNKDEYEVSLTLTESSDDSAAITGTVLDDSGIPVAGATVKLFDANGKPYLHVLTDSEGNYVFDDLSFGTYSLTAVSETCPITEPSTVILNSNEIQTVNFKLVQDTSIALGTVAGVVRELFDDGTSASLGGAKVYLKNATTEETMANTTSANDGEFVFYGIENGDYHLVATKDGYKLSSKILISIKDGNIVNSTLLIVKDPETNTGTISGFVKFNNTALTGVYVGLYEVNRTTGDIERCVATTRTNSIGYYMFGNVGEGNYVVKAKQNNS